MSTQQRGVYRRDQLSRLFDPGSIAVIGASPTPGSFGGLTMANLSQYVGRTYLVNGKYDRIGDQPCYPSVSALPETPDCALIALPREAVEAVVEECVARGVGGVIIYASGYIETGKPERAAQQERLAEIARVSGTPIVGPNVLGAFNFLTNAIISFMGVLPPTIVRQPAIGLVSQSGALGVSLGQAVETGVSFSHILLSGNSCDVDVADAISYLADEPACRAIACVFEGMPDPLRLLEAGEIARAAGKPVVVCKLGVGELGAIAAASHTGSLVGSDAAYRAVFRRAGMVVVDDFEALVEAAAFFAKVPPLKGRGVAIMTASGGSGILAADKAELHGVPLPQPSVEATRVLTSIIPEFGSPRNPCDMTAQVVSSPAMTRSCAEALLNDPSYGALVPIVNNSTPRAYASIAAYGELGRQHGKMICACWISQWNDGPGSREAAMDPNVALFRSPDRCFAAIAAWHAREDRLAQGPRQRVRLSPPEAGAKAAALIASSPHATLTEREAKAVLALYGVPVAGERLTHDADEAVQAAAALGYPVVLKIESPDIPHKTEAGAIRLDLKTECEVREAFDAVMTNAKAAVPEAGINGVLVQAMAPAGLEMMAGGRIDPQFGPLIVAGLGGVMVELMKDTALDLAPVTAREARAMLDRLRGRRVLDGFRGAAATDIDRLADIVVRLSEFADDQRELISEFDVNPLICAGDRIVAVDALIVRRS